MNIHTWTRLTRFDLQHLSISLGNAALAELPNWPRNGDGRAVKALTEQITRSLEATFDRRDLNHAFDILEGAISGFREIQENPFYQKSLANKLYSDRKGRATSYSEALSLPLQKTVEFLKSNRPPRPVLKTIKPDRPPKPTPAPDDLAIDRLSEVVPAQQSAPLKFEVKNGQLRTKRQSAKANSEDRRNIALARSAIQDDANSALAALRETNADPRLSVAISEIRDVLASDADIIRIGIVSLTCDSLVRKFAEQIPDIVSARLEAFSASLSLFVSQFPEWQRFVDNANSSSRLSESDVTLVCVVGDQLVKKLKQEDSLVDPQVPKSIELLLEAIRDPKRASRRAVFGVVRTLENLIGAIFIGFGGLLGSAFSGLKSGVKTSAKHLTVVGILSVAAQGATTLSPSVAKLTQSNWLEQASKIIEKAIEK